jgi:hypothetical protein
MTKHDDRTVANPDRTHVDDDPARAVREEDVHRTEEGREPHDQSRPALACGVKQAVKDADGPLG